MVVYDITNRHAQPMNEVESESVSWPFAFCRESFYAVKNWLEDAKKFGYHCARITIVGNKCDLGTPLNFNDQIPLPSISYLSCRGSQAARCDRGRSAVAGRPYECSIFRSLRNLPFPLYFQN